MKTTTYKDVLELNAAISKCVNKGIPVDAVLKLVDFKDELQEKIEKYQRVFKDIMSEYGIKEDNGVYNWSEAEKVEEISQKVTDLISAETELQHANFLDDTDLVKLTEGFSLAELSFVRKFLRKKA